MDDGKLVGLLTDKDIKRAAPSEVTRFEHITELYGMISNIQVKDIMTDPSDASITKAIIALAKGLGMTTIAEGVDSEDQMAFLIEQGCDQIQGFLISRPVPPEQVLPFLETSTVLKQASRPVSPV